VTHRSERAARNVKPWAAAGPGLRVYYHRGAARLAEPEGPPSPLILSLRPGSAAPQATGTALPCASGAQAALDRCQCPVAKDLKLALRVAASESRPAQVPRCAQARKLRLRILPGAATPAWRPLRLHTVTVTVVLASCPAGPACPGGRGQWAAPAANGRACTGGAAPASCNRGALRAGRAREHCTASAVGPGPRGRRALAT
jgi:hypothetical protein